MLHKRKCGKVVNTHVEYEAIEVWRLRRLSRAVAECAVELSITRIGKCCLQLLVRETELLSACLKYRDLPFAKMTFLTYQLHMLWLAVDDFRHFLPWLIPCMQSHKLNPKTMHYHCMSCSWWPGGSKWIDHPRLFLPLHKKEPVYEASTKSWRLESINRSLSYINSTCLHLSFQILGLCHVFAETWQQRKMILQYHQQLSLLTQHATYIKRKIKD